MHNFKMLRIIVLSVFIAFGIKKNFNIVPLKTFELIISPQIIEEMRRVLFSEKILNTDLF